MKSLKRKEGNQNLPHPGQIKTDWITAKSKIELDILKEQHEENKEAGTRTND